MTDIVERLEDASNAAGNVFDGIFQDSKQEIERLRQRVKELEDLRICADNDANDLSKELAELRRAHTELDDYKEKYLLLSKQTARAEERLEELEKAQGEPVGVVKHNCLGFPCVDLLGKNGTQYFGLEDGTKLYTSAPSIPDCNTCTNRGEINGLSQESYCEHCIYGAKYRTNHYAPKQEVK